MSAAAISEDYMALHNLVMTYCRAIDRRDIELLRSVYHPEAIEDRGDIFKGSLEQWIEWRRQRDAASTWELTTHRMFNTLFVIKGNEAEGEHYVEAYHRSLQPDAQELIIGGRYLDRYQKRDGVWRISSRTGVSDRAEVRPVNAAAYGQFVNQLSAGRSDGEDPSYRRLAFFARSGR